MTFKIYCFKTLQRDTNMYTGPKPWRLTSMSSADSNSMTTTKTLRSVFSWRASSYSEPHHANKVFKIFVIFRPKDGLAGYDISYRVVLVCLHKFYIIVGVIPKGGLAGLVPATFGRTVTKISNPVFGWRGSLLRRKTRGNKWSAWLINFSLFCRINQTRCFSGSSWKRREKWKNRCRNLSSLRVAIKNDDIYNEIEIKWKLFNND